MKGIGMNKNTTKVAGRLIAAAAISTGLAASAVSAASASEHGSRLSSHHGFASKAHWNNAGEGVVTAVAATSVTITAWNDTPSTFAITSATKFAEGSTTVTAADLVVGRHVDIQVSSTATATATSIDIQPARAIRLGGVVTVVTAASVTVTGHNGTPSTFTITSGTTFSEGSTTVTAAALVVGDRVAIDVSSAAMTTAAAIDVSLARVSGRVTAVSGDNITVMDHKGDISTIVVSAATTYTKDGAAAVLTDVTAGESVSAQGMIGATPTTLDASGVSIGNQCGLSDGSHGDSGHGHQNSDSRSSGGSQGRQSQGLVVADRTTTETFAGNLVLAR
jgi:hypothetical protein